MGRVAAAIAALSAVLGAVAPATQSSSPAAPATQSSSAAAPDSETIGKIGLTPSSRPSRGTPAPAVPPTPNQGQFPGVGTLRRLALLGPGEPVVEVGPTTVLQTVNTAATVYDKASGTKLAQFDFTVWWGAQTTECVDPRALYIASVDRFAFSCTDITPNKVSRIRFAISASGDPTGAWHAYDAPNRTFLDQDKIEATSDKFVVAGNSATFEQLYVYNLADLVAGMSNPPVVGVRATKSNVYQAAVQQTAVSPAYFVSSFPGHSLDLATITGTPAGANVALTEHAISTTDYPAPVEPSVPGGSLGAGDLDGRIYSAVFEVETSDKHPVIQYSSARLCGTRDCITSVRVDLSGSAPVVTQDTLIGEPGWDYTYGAPGLDAAGNVFEVYTRSNRNTPPGMAVTGPGFDVTVHRAVAGTNSCDPSSQPPCDERWGDYVGTGIDPSNPSLVWITGLYQQTNGGLGWGSWIDTVSLNRYTLPAATTGAATSITQGTAMVAGTVNPRGVATTYHFDYGTTTGYDASTPKKSAGSGSTSVSVSAKLSGLVANTTYHYRLVATTSAGSAVGADSTFTTSKPAVTTVAFTGTPANPTVTITGTFGAEPAHDPATPLNCVNGDTSYDFGTSGLWFTDATRSWTAGQIGDCIGLAVTSFTSTQIVYTFGADYGAYPPLANGEAYQLVVDGVTATGTVSGF